jgi:phytoene synthase
VAAVVGRLLAAADRYYLEGDDGIARLSWRNAWAVTVARGVYSEIGALVRRRGAAAWDRRAVVSRPRKLAWVLRGLLRAVRWGVQARLAGPAKRGARSVAESD